jgi:hypothetical protein
MRSNCQLSKIEHGIVGAQQQRTLVIDAKYADSRAANTVLRDKHTGGNNTDGRLQRTNENERDVAHLRCQRVMKSVRTV